MSSFGIRPRFSQTLELSVEEVHAKILQGVEEGEHDCEVKSFPGFICLRIPESDRHFWSPRLMLSLEKDEDQKTTVTGVYGPNANVWSLFFFGYLITGSLGLFSGVLAVSQWMIGRNPWGLWIFGPMLVAAIGLYIMAQFGQKLGALQTFRLHQIYESAMAEPVDIH